MRIKVEEIGLSDDESFVPGFLDSDEGEKYLSDNQSPRQIDKSRSSEENGDLSLHEKSDDDEIIEEMFMFRN